MGEALCHNRRYRQHYKIKVSRGAISTTFDVWHPTGHGVVVWQRYLAAEKSTIFPTTSTSTTRHISSNRLPLPLLLPLLSWILLSTERDTFLRSQFASWNPFRWLEEKWDRKRLRDGWWGGEIQVVVVAAGSGGRENFDHDNKTTSQIAINGRQWHNFQHENEYQ